MVVKEIRFGPQTDDHDYEFKKKHAEKFLEEGSKLKPTYFLKDVRLSLRTGRNFAFKTCSGT